jgi:hypothetical protein
MNNADISIRLAKITMSDICLSRLLARAFSDLVAGALATRIGHHVASGSALQ